jgi:hypothetical protein
MIRAAVALCLLASCTHTTELLEPHKRADGGGPVDAASNTPRDGGGSAAPDAIANADGNASPTDDAIDAREAGIKLRYDFCPTRIDVYGGINMQLAGCGGSQRIPSPIESGYFSPGASEYDGTVAGRLLARIEGDPELEPLFGSAWIVRSCAGAGETLSQVAPPISEDACGPDSPDSTGQWLASCASEPAPVVLLSAGMFDDACHGGGPDSDQPDDPTTYVKHFAQRMDAFLASRNPGLALVGPMTEWTDAPPYAQNNESGCRWKRPDWDELGLQTWSDTRADTVDVELVPDLHAEFQEHNKCCLILAGSCSTNWFSRDSQNPEMVNCDGAQAIVDLWYSRLKATLLAREFRCP